MFLSSIVYSVLFPIALASGNVNASTEVHDTPQLSLANYSQKSVFLNKIREVITLDDSQAHRVGLFYRQYKNERYKIRVRYANEVSNESRLAMRSEIRKANEEFKSSVMAVLTSDQADKVKFAEII